MKEDLLLRSKWTFRAEGRKAVFVKKAYEGAAHVLMKALLWALYLPEYPGLMIEVSIGDRYRPDLVQMDPTGTPQFWGELGRVGSRKIHGLIRRYRRTHFAFGKWHTDLAPLASIIEKAVGTAAARNAPVDLISFPKESAERFIGSDGEIRIHWNDLDWMRIDGRPGRSPRTPQQKTRPGRRKDGRQSRSTNRR